MALTVKPCYGDSAAFMTDQSNPPEQLDRGCCSWWLAPGHGFIQMATKAAWGRGRQRAGPPA